MIRNIVFDMGNVLIDYQPLSYAKQFFSDESEVQLVYRELFSGPEWLKLDEGIMEPEDAIASVCTRLPKAMHSAAKELFLHWFDFIEPIQGMNELARRLKHAGYAIYILSNAAYSFHLYEKRIPIFSLLDGCIVSADEKIVKPSPAIYQLLCSRYHLRPEECYFIDDRLENVQAAQQCGMSGYCYQMDTERLTAALLEAGVAFK
ncbi:HAD family hydrolase [Anaeromassilibacillus senegalensis]|uniref:HAD family hydrolase n=1 Tax=Anaeromassilibacillus senegalensis TaxID=1673717 RepID=UPI00067FD68C|nr:HAD family phosphatase [Anaeromassilibacillus senegalensis]